MSDFLVVLLENVELSIHMEQVFLMLFVSITFILFGYFKLSLITQFIFIIYWLFLDYKSFSRNTKIGNIFLTENFMLLSGLIILTIVIITVIKRLKLFRLSK